MKPFVARFTFLLLTFLILISFIVTIGYLIFRGALLDWESILIFGGVILASMVTLLSFYQKQDLEETTLFKQLFTEFNTRYDRLNSGLNRFIREDDSKGLTPEDWNLLYDYFNLCGEEYLFYKRGYIYPEVWKSWCKGIDFYMHNPRIRTLWEEEEKIDYYYGLTLKIIRNTTNK